MEKLEGKSFDMIKEKMEILKQIFPEAFTEGKFHLHLLKEQLGDFSDKKQGNYEFNWPDKTEAIHLAQKQTTATLRPVKEDSVNFDDTKNLYIEGDNLEVLRVLQSSYNNKVDFIYIDPPFNTGKDFIYKDDFKDNLANYKERLSSNMKSNPATEGRFHTNWLNFIYPRLKIARNLLTEKGFIYISIGDDEFANLKKVCDEIFGEFNFITTTVWNCSTGGGIRPKFFSTTHEYGLVYAKNINLVGQLFAPLSQEAIKLYTKEDEVGLYREKDFVFKNDSNNINQKYLIECPDGTFVKPKGGYIYRFVKETYTRALENNEVVFKETNRGPLVTEGGEQAHWNIYIKKYLGDATGAPNTIIPRDQVGIYNNGTRMIQDLFDGLRVFQNPKPVEYLKYLLSIFTKKDALVMDFFSGSATLGQAVLEHNLKNQSDSRYILVQLPEDIEGDSDAGKLGFTTICEVGKERLRRVGQHLLKENADSKLDIGFKVFRLDSSNIKSWDEDGEDLEANLFDLVDPIKDGRTEADVVYEVLLKFGVDLTIPIEEMHLAEKTVYSVGMGYLLICLERNLTTQQIEDMAKLKPARIVFYDEGFKDDTVRVNAQQILKRYGVEDIRVI